MKRKKLVRFSSGLSWHRNHGVRQAGVVLIFIEQHVVRGEAFFCSWIKTLIGILSCWIIEKNKSFGFWLNFIWVIRPGERITNTPRFFEFQIIWGLTKMNFKRWFVLKVRRGLMIYEVRGILKGTGPIQEVKNCIMNKCNPFQLDDDYDVQIHHFVTGCVV